MAKITVTLKNPSKPASRMMVRGGRTDTYYGRYCHGEVLEIDERDFNTRRFQKSAPSPKTAAKKGRKPKVAPVPPQPEADVDGEA